MRLVIFHLLCRGFRLLRDFFRKGVVSLRGLGLMSLLFDLGIKLLVFFRLLFCQFLNTGLASFKHFFG